MVHIATEVTPIPCATDLEAEVRELRLITELQPPYNRRSRRVEKAPWVRVTEEPFPRLSIVGEVRVTSETDEAAAVHSGPFSSRPQAHTAGESRQQACSIRQRGGRPPSTARSNASAHPLPDAP